MEYPHVKFLKIVSTEAADTFDDVCLPSISVYAYTSTKYHTINPHSETLYNTLSIPNLYY